TWMVRRSVPASNKWVAQLWRRVCGVTCLRMPARCAASLHAIQTVLSEIGSSSLWRRVRVGNMYSFGFRHRQYSRNVSNSAGLRGRSRSFATLARHHTDDHALTIDVADFKTSEFAASHAGAVERHQQRRSKQVPGRVDQTRNFFPAQHRWQPAPILRVRQEIAELMTLESLDEEEPQRRHLVDHATRR